MRRLFRLFAGLTLKLLHTVEQCRHQLARSLEESLMRIQKKVALTFIATVIMVSAAPITHTFAEAYLVGKLVVGQPWSRATPSVAPVAGGYLAITNNGSESDFLLGGSSPNASSVEVHESTTQDGVARMRPLPEGLVIAPGQTVELKPGATHLMFVKPLAPFKQGDKIDATLKFKIAGEIKVQFDVQGMGAKGPPDASSHQGHGN